MEQINDLKIDPSALYHAQAQIENQKRQIQALSDSNTHLQNAHKAAYDRWIQAAKVTEETIVLMFFACVSSFISTGVAVWLMFVK